MSPIKVTISGERAALVGGVVLAVGIALLAISYILEPSVLTVQLFALILSMAGMLGAFYGLNAQHRRQLFESEFDKVQRNTTTGSGSKDIGLAKIEKDATLYDYGPLIANSRVLFIVLNQGQPWVSIHKDRLKSRFKDPTKETTIFLVHPASPVVDLLAKKAAVDREKLAQKLLESISQLSDLSPNPGNVNIYGHHLFNTYFAMVGDNEAAIAPYFLSRGSDVAPVFQFENTGENCFYREICSDVKRLKLDSEDLRPWLAAVRNSASIIPLGSKLGSGSHIQ